MLSAKKIAPGKIGRIEARIKTNDFSGRIEKRIILTTNDPRNASITLSIKATVEAEVDASDSSIFFDNIPAGIETTREIILTISARKAVRILSVVSKDPNVSARLEDVPGSSGKRVRLIATRKSAAKPGSHFGSIVLKTDSRRTPEVVIYTRGLVTER